MAAKHAKFLKAEKYTHSNTWFFPHSTSMTVLVTSAREAAEGKCEDIWQFPTGAKELNETITKQLGNIKQNEAIKFMVITCRASM